MNKHTVQRTFQLKGWQARKRAAGHRPRIQALPSVATVPDQRWATDLCRVQGGQILAIVIDCHARQLLGWQLSRSGKASTVAATLEHAGFGTLRRVPALFLLRSDHGLVFSSRSDTRLVRSDSLQQAFITPRCPCKTGRRASSVPSRNNAYIVTASRASNTPCLCRVTGATPTTTDAHIRRSA